VLAAIALTHTLAAPSHAQTTNSWIDGSGKWETTNNWSLDTAPNSSQSAVLITNSPNNTTTIDATTSGSFPATMTISNLLVGGNILSSVNAGTGTPLHVLNSFILTNSGALLISNAAVQIDRGIMIPFFGSRNVVPIDSGSLTVLSGLLTLTNSTLVVGRPVVPLGGGLGGAAFTVAGGTALMGGLDVNDVFDTAGSNSIVWVTGGTLDVVGQILIGNDIPAEGSLILSNGTVLAGSLGMNNATCKIVGGLMTVKNSAIIGDIFGDSGSLTVQGGTFAVTNASHNGTISLAFGDIFLTGGSILADSLVVTNLFGHTIGFVVNVSGTLTVGGLTVFNNGTMSTAGGLSVLSSNLIAGSVANSTGTVEVTAGQLVVTNGVIGIGNDGTSTNGVGTVAHMTVSNGTVLANHILLGSSAGGAGGLTIGDGGVVDFSFSAAGTNTALVANDLIVNGGLLAITNGTIYCGQTHPGAMVLSNGAAVCQDVYVGFDSTGTMAMSGGTMSSSSRLIVGHLGLDVASVISTGVVWISGGVLTVTNLYSIIGNSGVGQMTMSNGTVTAADVVVGNSANPTSFGTLTLAGGTLTVKSLMLPNPHSRFIFAGGWLNALGITNSNGQMLTLGNGVSPITLNLLGGISSLGIGLKIATNATLSGFGTITGNVVNYGLIASGNGVLNFTGGVLTNYGTILTTAGGAINFYGTVVNNGLILTNGGIHFLGMVKNDGLLLDPTADTDGDGMNNLWEALAGTNPTNSASFFHLKAITTVGDDVQVIWSSVGGKSYVVQAAPVSAGGSTNSYTDISSVITTPGTGESTMSYTDPGAANGPPRFYRIRLGP